MDKVDIHVSRLSLKMHLLIPILVEKSVFLLIFTIDVLNSQKACLPENAMHTYISRIVVKIL